MHMKQATIVDTKSLKLRIQWSSFVQPDNSGVKESFLSYFYSLQIHFPSTNSKKVLLNIKLYIFIIHIGGQRKTIMNSGQHHRTHHLIPGNVCKKRMLKYKIIFIKFPFKKTPFNTHSITALQWGQNLLFKTPNLSVGRLFRQFQQF